MQEIHTTEHDVINRYVRGLLLRSKGRAAEAADEFQSLIARTDTIGLLSRHHYALARRTQSSQALKAGDFALAERHLRAAMDAVGADGGLRGGLAGLCARSGDAQSCLREMEKASAATDADDSPAFVRKLAQAQWQAGQREDAYLTLHNAFRRFGGVGILHRQMGLFLAAEQRFAEARSYLARAATAECDNPDAHRYLALVLSTLGDPAGAARSFQRALNLQPDNLMLAFQLSLAARAAGEAGENVVVRLPEPMATAADGSLRELAERIAADPDLVESLCSLPVSECDEELLAMLAGAAELAIEAHEKYADVYLAASRVYARLGQHAAAEDRAQRALEINPGYLRARLHLAEVLAASGRPAPAAWQYERAIADGADWPDIHLRAGEALAGCGQADRARAHLQRALELNSGYRPAEEALAALEGRAA